MSPAAGPGVGGGGWDPPREVLSKNRREVERVVRGIAGDVANLEDATLRRLIPSLLQARTEAHDGLEDWLSRSADWGDRFTAQDFRRAIVSLDGAFEAIEAMYPAMFESLVDASERSGRMAVGHLREELAAFGAIFGETIRPTQISTAAVIATARHTLIPQFRTSAKRYAGSMRDDLEHLFRVGLAKGETFEQLTNRLARMGGPRGLVALRGVVGEPGARVEHIAEGLFQRYRHWAERLVRAEVMNAYNVQHAVAIDELNGDLLEGEEPFLLRWDAAADNRLCPTCGGLDRRVIAPGGTFPGGYKRPPAHPRCRCVAVAWHASWGDIKGEVPAIGDIPKGKPRPAPPERPPAPKPERKPPAPRKPRAKPESPPSPPAKPPAPRPPAPDVAEEARRRAEDLRRRAAEERERAKRLRDERRELERQERARRKAEKAAAGRKAREEARRAGIEKRKAAAAARPKTVRELKAAFAADPSFRAAAATYDLAGIHAAFKTVLKREEFDRQGKPDIARALESLAAIAKAPKSRDNPFHGAIVRSELERLMRSYGLQTALSPEATLYLSTSVKPDKAMMGADGELSVRPKGMSVAASVARGAASAAAKLRAGGVDLTPDEEWTWHVIVHEQLHATSPIPPGAFPRGFIFLEESTTEISARKLVRETLSPAAFHAQRPTSRSDFRGAYNSYLVDMHGAIRDALHVPDDQAWDIFEAAALRYKTRGRATPPADLIEAFAEDVIAEAGPHATPSAIKHLATDIRLVADRSP